MNHRSRGFTLLELLVVLAIVALAAALVAPNIPGVIGSTRLTAAAEITVAFLREARARAIVDGVAVDFEVDPRTGAYRFADRSKSVNASVAVALTANLPAGRKPGSPGVSRAEKHAIALLLAESKLAEVGVTVPLQSGRREGEFASFRWRTNIGPLAPAVDANPSVVESYRVDVEVRETGVVAAAARPLVHLKTIRLGIKRRLDQ